MEKTHVYIDWKPKTSVQSADGESTFTDFSGSEKKLTVRELQFLTLLYDGYTHKNDLQQGLLERDFNREKLSPYTIRNHLQTLYQKLGVPEIEGDGQKIWALRLGSVYGLIPTFGSATDIETRQLYLKLQTPKSGKKG